MRERSLRALTEGRRILSRPTTWLLLIFCWIASEVIAQRSSLLDFTVYWHAAERFSKGESLYASMIDFTIPQTGDQYSLPYLYPPFFTLVFLPLLPLGIGVAKVLWLMVMLLAYLVTVHLLPSFCAESRQKSARDRELTFLCIALFVAGFRPIWYSVLVGQPTGLLCLLLVCLLIFLKQRRSIAAGVVTACMAALKITPAGLFLLPLLWKDWRMLSAGVFSGVLILLVLCFSPHGVQALTEFFVVLPQLDLSLSRPPVTYNISPVSILSEPVHTSALRVFSQIVAILTMSLPWAIVFSMRIRSMPMFAACMPAIIAVSVCSPIVWSHHLPILGVSLALYVLGPATSPGWLRYRQASGFFVFIMLAYGSIIARQFSSQTLQADLTRIIPNVALLLLLFGFAAEIGREKVRKVVLPVA